jgi:hypothetical protein
MRDVGVALSHPDVALLPTSFIDQVSVYTKSLSWLPIRFRWLDTMCEHGMSELSRVSIRVSFMGGADGEDGMDVDADDGKSSVFFRFFFSLTVFFCSWAKHVTRWSSSQTEARICNRCC